MCWVLKHRRKNCVSISLLLATNRQCVMLWKSARWEIASFAARGWVQRDPSQARFWYARAAEQGHVGAQDRLGNMYFHGQGVEQDYIQAAFWFRKAAEQGDADAQYSLGRMYLLGIYGLRRDIAKANFWLKKASEQGLPSASIQLARISDR